MQRLLHDVTTTVMIELEEHIRPRLVQMVHTTVLTQLQNVRLDITRTALPPRISPGSHPLQTFPSAQTTTHTAPMEERTYTTSTEMADPFSSDTRATSPTLGPWHDGKKPPANPSAIAELGSTSLTTDCDCLCHGFSNLIKAAFGQTPSSITSLIPALMVEYTELRSCEDCSFIQSRRTQFQSPWLRRFICRIREQHRLYFRPRLKEELL